MIDITDNSPNQATIGVLRDLLAQAESGDLRTVLVVGGYKGDTWSNVWSIDYRNSRRKMLGESAMLHHDLLTNQSLDDGDSVLSRALL